MGSVVSLEPSNLPHPSSPHDPSGVSLPQDDSEWRSPPPSSQTHRRRVSSSSHVPLPHYPPLESWSTRQTGDFLATILCLPQDLARETKVFVERNRITGTILSRMSEGDLRRAGFNGKWCESIADALKRVKEREWLIANPPDTPLPSSRPTIQHISEEAHPASLLPQAITTEPEQISSDNDDDFSPSDAPASEPPLYFPHLTPPKPAPGHPKDKDDRWWLTPTYIFIEGMAIGVVVAAVLVRLSR